MTSWINPETLEALDHLVRWQPRSLQQWHDASAWCDDHIGPRCDAWYDHGAEMQISYEWWFGTREDAVLFMLRWL